MPDDILTYLFTQGVLGVAVAALVVERVRVQKRLDQKDARIEELHGLRLEETKDGREKMTEVLQDVSLNVRILSEKIEVGKRNK